MKTCTDCEQPFLPDDSLGSDFDLCQNCWESYCSKTWWEAVAETQEAINRLSKGFLEKVK